MTSVKVQFKDQPKTIYASVEEASTETGIGTGIILHRMKNFPDKWLALSEPGTLHPRIVKIGPAKGIRNEEPTLPLKPTVRKRKSLKRLAVKNVTKNIYYHTFLEAAKDAGVTAWTLSAKTQSFGYFVNKNGERFERLVPYYSRGTNSYEKCSGSKPCLQREALKGYSRAVPETINYNEPVKTIIGEDKVSPKLSNTVSELVTENNHTEQNDVEMLTKLAHKYTDKGCWEVASKILLLIKEIDALN